MSKTRVLVIEDSLTVRRRLVLALAADPGCEVVGEAEDGDRGIALCESLRPDVIHRELGKSWALHAGPLLSLMSQRYEASDTATVVRQDVDITLFAGVRHRL